MTADITKNEAGKVLAGYLEEARNLRAARKYAPHAEDWPQLKAWQSNRLASTHADLLANERYRPAAEFFLSDLYGPKDFSPRDDEMARVLPLMTSMLPVSALVALIDAIRMDALSESLDDDMVKAVAGRDDGRHGVFQKFIEGLELFLPGPDAVVFEYPQNLFRL